MLCVLVHSFGQRLPVYLSLYLSPHPARHPTQRIQNLNLSRCPRVTSRALSVIAGNIRRLKSLSTALCRDVDSRGIIDLVSRSAGQLLVVDLQGCDKVWCRRWRDVMVFPTSHSGLTILPHQIDDSGVIAIAKHCKLLKSANFSRYASAICSSHTPARRSRGLIPYRALLPTQP